MQSPKEILDGMQNISGVEKIVDSEAAQVGLSYFFKCNMLEEILDFMLGDKSPKFTNG
jgi:hypothetical protein